MRKQKKKTRSYVAEIALSVVEKAIGEKLPGNPELSLEPESDIRNQDAVMLSKLGASKSGNARAKKISKAKRRKIEKKSSE